MNVTPLQIGHAELSSPGAFVRAYMPQPVRLGSLLVFYLEFSPISGIPTVTDSLNSQFLQVGSIQVAGSKGIGVWCCELQSASAGYWALAYAVGGNQTLDCTIAEFALSPIQPAGTTLDEMLAELVRIRTSLRG